MAGIALKGSDIDLKIDSSIVATGTDWSINPSKEMIEVTTLKSGRGRFYIPGRVGYTLSVNGLVFRGEGATQAGYVNLFNKMVNTDASVNWTATLDSSSAVAFQSGWGYITSAPVQFGDNAAITYSIEIQGCGVPTINTAF